MKRFHRGPVVTIPLQMFDKMRNDIDDLSAVIAIKDNLIGELEEEVRKYHRNMEELKEKYAALMESVRRQEAAW